MSADHPPGTPREDVRSRARAELVWYLRHADALARWPVLPEAWAQSIERHRLGGADGPQDRAPGAPARPVQ